MALIRGLRIAFNITNAKVDCPDVTVRLGEYEWQLHKDVLTQNSGFFKIALEGSFLEANTKIVALHDDSPFTIGRAIEFMYMTAYSAEHVLDDTPRAGSVQSVDLKSMMPRFRGIVPSYENDRKADTEKPEEFRHCLMIIFADKYHMPLLLRTAVDALRTLMLTDIFRMQKSFWECESLLTKERICRHHYLQESLADMLASGAPPYTAVRIKEWFTEFPEFACLVFEKQRLNIKSMIIDHGSGW